MAKDIQDAVDAVVGTMTIEELVDQTVTPDPTPEPDPSAATVRSIVEKLQHPSQHNGYLGIARSEGVSVGTVKLIERAVQARIAELNEV
jgi:hypothetical protein